MSYTLRIRRTATAALALAAGASLFTAPVATAQLPDDVRTSPAWDVPMAYPGGGVHTMRFGTLVFCSRENPEFQWGQAMSANAYDIDAPMSGFGSEELSASLYPFNSATVEWENLETGRRGSETVHTNGREVGIGRTFTDFGDLLVTITVTRSALPTFSPGSAVPLLSSTHTERFLAPATTCDLVDTD